MILRLWPLALIVYTDNLPEGVGGRANGPLVRIRPKYRTDAGLHEHELTHVTQWWITLGLHPLLYLFRPYRLWAEAKAYKEQTRHPDREGNFLTLEQAAVLLADKRYGLELTLAEAYSALSTL